MYFRRYGIRLKSIYDLSLIIYLAVTCEFHEIIGQKFSHRLGRLADFGPKQGFFKLAEMFM